MSDMVVRAVVLACWGLFAVVWTVGAVLGWRTGGRAIRISFRQYVVAAPLIVAGWAVARWLPRSWWAAVTVTSRWPIVLGLAVLVVGTGVTLWARLALGSMWSSEVRVAENHQLRTTGPYGVTRHPIYSGLLTMVVGAVLATGWAGDWW
ncbi:hypothetical protein HFP15_29085 [Amycolatopsis sp. K13G38]|uniref:Isoprenylcysteine carboxylmethyltransferase family protein n=1 Tax=Amycolatopsis acididurans TaxID=2724524 RepID=A0ABX1JFB9_9PSEU|nr:methyltransferase [Amycolatopsis acididurans]NKQ56932.1 hypothetical protein [Amycolatopsis acididurans]